MATASNAPVPDRNSLGKASFIIGLIALVLSFIPIVGFVSWLLAPLAVIFGLIAIRRTSRSLAIAGIITGVIALFVCFSWIKGTQAVGTALNRDTFNTNGETKDLSAAPILQANVKQIWTDIEANKVSAGQKYGGSRLQFTNEKIADFAGDAAAPVIQFLGHSDGYINEFAGASFSQEDGKAIANFKKGDKISFVCEKIGEAIMGGYSLSGCRLK
ncbi:DUF4190 domain-containing protein [Novosphingobium sp.]|uniref:DUF4190 domain-containing protein n=1 Tax=Novosphingobium sp. TaxID=1874826 RepID=UPI00286BEA9C|nr:DUF4190 domain-containing protein [Novosphingobium sp.]